MGLGDVIVWGAIAALAVWAFVAMSRALRQDHDWHARLRAFAASRGLVEKTVERGASEVPSDTPITWPWLKERFSCNPAAKAAMPPALFEGTCEGFDFVMDEVGVRRTWSRTEDYFLRMAVRIPDMPSGLSVSPAGRMQRWLWRLTSAPARPGNLVCTCSSQPTDRSREHAFLTGQRLGILAKAQGRFGGVHVHDGRLMLVRRRGNGTRIDLEALYRELGALAAALTV